MRMTLFFTHHQQQPYFYANVYSATHCIIKPVR